MQCHPSFVTDGQEIFQDAEVMYGENIPALSSSSLSSSAACGSSYSACAAASSAFSLLLMVYGGSELLGWFYLELDWG